MSREFSIRVSQDLGHWCRDRGPASRLIGAIAGAAHQGLIRVDVKDPGPGPERLTVRIPERALPMLRKLTHSRNNLVALRKIIAGGYQARALPPAVIEVPVIPGVALAVRGRGPLCPVCEARRVQGLPSWHSGCPIGNGPAKRLQNRRVASLEGHSQRQRLARPPWWVWLVIFSPLLIFLALAALSRDTEGQAAGS